MLNASEPRWKLTKLALLALGGRLIAVDLGHSTWPLVISLRRWRIRSQSDRGCQQSGVGVMSDQEVEAIDKAAVECLESIAQALSAYARLNGAQGHKQKQRTWDSLSFHKDEAELHHAQAVSALKGLVERVAR